VTDASTSNKELIPPSYCNTARIREVPVKCWQEIFDLAGESQIIKSLSYTSITEFFSQKQEVDPRFISALEIIYRLGDSLGRSLLEDASTDAGVSFDFPDEESDAEIAAKIWIAARKNKTYWKVIDRASINLEYHNKSKNIREYQADTSFKLDKIDTEQLTKMISEWCQENKKGDVVSIYAYTTEGLWCCNIVRGGPLKRQATVTQKKLGEIEFTPAVVDHVRIDPESGLLGIVSRTLKDASAYREILGKITKNDSNFFSNDNICSLIPLQENLSALFQDEKPTPIRNIRVTELKWRGSDRETLIVKGRDCFKILSDLEVNLDIGDLIEATIYFSLYGEARPIKVSIAVPSRITIPEGKYELIISRYLTQIGIKGRFNSDDDHKNFWELNPWILSESEWRSKIGTDFETLKKSGCLVNIEKQTIRHPEHQTSRGDMAVEMVGTAHIAVSDDIDIGVRTVTATDREGYQLNIQRIFEKLQQALNLESAMKARELEKGLWILGNRSFNTTNTIQVYLAISKPSKNFQALITQSANGFTPIIITPSDCSYNSEIKHITTKLTSLYFEDLLPRMVKVLNWETSLEPIDWRNEDLILWPSQNKAWYKKSALRDVNFDEHDFKFALEVAQSKGDVISKGELNDLLSIARLDSTAAKNAKLKFMKKINAAIRTNANPTKAGTNDIFRASGNGYRQICSVYII